MRVLDLTGKRFGKLTAIEFANEYDESRNRIWLCRCECGKLHKVAATDLKNGLIKSCGCSHNDHIKLLHKNNTTHNMSKTKLYRIWSSMKDRCKSNSTHSKHYADRGIHVCEEWQSSFEPFYRWSMENGYKEGLTIDRIDNDKGYCPSNCRWVTMKVQSNNTRSNAFFTFNGKTQTIQQWSDETGINDDTIRCRIKAGWPNEYVLSKENFRGNNQIKNNRREKNPV